MEVDPLADTVPPRHAIESDEEEDEFNPLPSSSLSKAPPPTIDVNIIGQIPLSRGLVVASGDAAKVWAKGAQLGEQSGAVMANGVQVGLIFNPSWTQANVLISEVTTRLPSWAMHRYAEVVIQQLKPPSVALLDTYAVPAYISAEPVPYHEAPARQLRTKGSCSPTTGIQPFAPPNLIQSTSASFLSILSLPSADREPSASGTLILLPSAHIPPPPPNTIAPTNISRLEDVSDGWPTQILQAAQQALFAAIGEKCNMIWEVQKGNKRDKEMTSGRRRDGDLGEGGMYI
jgi:hypothetical protein